MHKKKISRRNMARFYRLVRQKSTPFTGNYTPLLRHDISVWQILKYRQRYMYRLTNNWCLINQFIGKGAWCRLNLHRFINIVKIEHSRLSENHRLHVIINDIIDKNKTQRTRNVTISFWWPPSLSYFKQKLSQWNWMFSNVKSIQKLRWKPIAAENGTMKVLKSKMCSQPSPLSNVEMF